MDVLLDEIKTLTKIMQRQHMEANNHNVNIITSPTQPLHPSSGQASSSARLVNDNVTVSSAADTNTVSSAGDRLGMASQSPRHNLESRQYLATSHDSRQVQNQSRIAASQRFTKLKYHRVYHAEAYPIDHATIFDAAGVRDLFFDPFTSPEEAWMVHEIIASNDDKYNHSRTLQSVPSVDKNKSP